MQAPEARAKLFLITIEDSVKNYFKVKVPDFILTRRASNLKSYLPDRKNGFGQCSNVYLVCICPLQVMIGDEREGMAKEGKAKRCRHKCNPFSGPFNFLAWTLFDKSILDPENV